MGNSIWGLGREDDHHQRLPKAVQSEQRSLVVAGHRRGGGWRLRAHGGAACQQGAQKCDGWPGGGPEWLVTGGNPVAARSSAGFNIPCHRWVTLFALGGGRMRGSAPQLAALGHSPSATVPGATMSIV
jgi:hypothetical protein